MAVARLLFSTLGIIAVLAAPRHAAAQAAGATTATAPATEEITPTPSAWSWIKMPKITMPKIEMPKMPADPLAPVKTSARKVGDGAKKAWEGTKELLTFGPKETADQPAARVASREQPSLWSRMFGSAEPEPEGPQSVAEWMNQPRIDP
jgi:hypothetical protein